MKIIKRGSVPCDTKQIRCTKCNTLFEVEKRECNVTSQLGVMHDGMGAYNIDCPVCGVNLNFDWK